ncbi:protein ndvB [Paracoccus sp. S-4012]|uniref:GH36-type glycosyl hydrolase domain-containing protein n=1 Tax=Paracoccus sp. S-4012 TaxID=2665648 RepID=UPI0012B01B5C|nr:glucoamylase family protein [Paracoccus sp. S-4012]MRX50785.1 protein ndvB [Paracoccus sp. S-4012]
MVKHTRLSRDPGNALLRRLGVRTLRGREAEPPPGALRHDPRRQPLRGDGWSGRSLRQCGIEVATDPLEAAPDIAAVDLRQRLRDNREAIRRNYLTTLAAARSGHVITPAAEWLIDNQHVIDEAFRLQREALGPGFLRHLPTLALPRGGRAPRVHALAHAFVAATNSDIHLEALTESVHGFQEVETLTIAELWALPAFLRFVLLENLRRLSDLVVDARESREAADALADALAAAGGTREHHALLDGAEGRLDDPTFAMQLSYRLSEAAAVDTRAELWLHEGLASRGSAIELIVQHEYARQSATNVTVGNVVRSLRRMGDINWLNWFEEVSRVDAVLRDGSDFTRLDQPTRAAYRDAIERLARRSGRSETEVAQAATAAAARPEDVGALLIGADLRRFEALLDYRPTSGERLRRAYARLGWLGIALPAVLLAVGLLALLGRVLPPGIGGGLGVLLLGLAFFAAADAALGLVALVTARLVAPHRLPAYDFRAGVPSTHRTLVVIPCLLGSRETIDELVQQLELHYLANPLGDVSFALLTDWTDADAESAPGDGELLDHARAGIERLADLYDYGNRRRFFLLHRGRQWNASEGKWMGWERKRGKLEELNRLLRGGADETSFMPTGPLPPEGIRYVVTLDSDTRLPRGTVAQLAGKLAHPVNQPVIDAETRRVVRGHAILQPRISASLTTGAEASIFQRVFSVSRGLDPYVFAVSDLYQDLVEEGSFTGKGIYHLDSFEEVTRDRFPENTILSHDLIEGSFARAALVSDIEMVEEYPIRYQVERGRQHRWTRGDWQLLPFILRRGNGLGGLGRFKMLDNLRRSLVAPGWVLASVLGWFALPPGWAAAWQAGLVALIALMPLVHQLLGLRPGGPNVALGYHLRRIAHDAGKALLELGLKIAFVADYAVVMTDAVVRTLWRLLVSRRHLLEWTTAGEAARLAAGASGRQHLRMMGPGVALAVVVGVALLLLNPGALAVAAPFLAAWIAAPWIAAWVSDTMETEDRLDIAPADAAALRAVGRRTWRYFEAFVGPATNHLPPDNFQDDPHPKLAERTSPTNIGFYLLSVLSANDLGWIGRAEALQRIGDTLDTLERLPRQGGHFYNWYDTRDLSVLQPPYISSVDSGNLAGTLVALCAGLKRWLRGGEPQGTGLAGLGDTLHLFRQHLILLPEDRRSAPRTLRRRIDDLTARLAVLLNEAADGPEALAHRVHGIVSGAETLARLANDLDGEIGSPVSAEVLAWAQALRATAGSVLGDTAPEADPHAFARVVESLAERARLLAFQMDFRFLVDPEKQLLSVGYRPDEEERDQSCYDLLASEARLTSFFAIAKGDLRKDHWGHLGRPFASLGGGEAALMSWSGCMFEYLMAPLVMKEQLGGILNLSSHSALKEQIRYGAERGVPWGISESAMNARDREMNYQYYAFGVPTLGLKRVVANDLVIAPYATILAAQFRPEEAVRNLERLEKHGALGPHGFYDAVDFTRSRLVEGAQYAVVRNVMAHHHGMSIVAVANAVLDGIHRERFHEDPVVQAAELLLQERSPREIVPVTRPEDGFGVSGAEERFEAPAQSQTDDPANARRDIALLSNGRLSATLSSTGAGQAQLLDIALNRWLPDPAVNQGGIFLFLRDLETFEWWSASTSPRRASQGETASTLFSDHKAEFFKYADEIETRMEVIAASESDAEGRRLTIRNRSDRERLIEVTSYGEIVLDNPANDRAHPAFSKLFVRTSISEDRSTVFARRRPRDPRGKAWYLAHLVTGDDAAILPGAEAETDRRAFIGRGRGLGRARAFDPGARLEGHQGFTLDPVFSLRRVVRLAPRQSVDLTFWTIVGDNEENTARAAQHYAVPRVYDHELNLAWSYSQVQLRHLDVSMADATLFRRFAALLVYPDPSLAAADTDRRGGLGPQSDLWPMGISGDYPIILLRIDDESDMPILRGAMRMHRYLRARGIVSDLVILNERGTSYVQDLQAQIDAMVEAAAQFAPTGDISRNVFKLRRDLLAPQSAATLMAAARIVLHTRNGRLAEQIARLDERRANGAGPAVRTAPLPAAPPRAALPAPPLSGEGLEFWNGIGGFAAGGREYVVRLRHGESTPHPWINVIAREDFGFHVSAGGAGYTWAVNSRDYQITPWANDPVVNRCGEAIHILDRDTGRIATPFNRLSDDPEAVFEARHGIGWSRFTGRTSWLEVEATQTLADGVPAKLTRLRLKNLSGKTLRLETSAYAELVLGQHRSRTATALRAGFDLELGAVVARNPYETAVTGRVTALSATSPADGWLVSRLEWLGRGGAMMRPAAVTDWPRAKAFDTPFAGETHGDPCVAMMCRIEVPAGETRELTFVLADAPEAELPAVLRQATTADAMERALASAARDWDGVLDTLQVKTPDHAFDLMVNTWLPYQSLGCRLRARTAFYQASGAFGFRDQLQDTLSLMLQDPGLARAQLLNAGSRQFREGDVQHWWLPGTGAGVRTMIVDDVVWLAYGTATYIAATGDTGILDEPLPWLEGPALDPGEHDRFFQPDVTTETASLYEHCARALDLCIARSGPRGLPLFLGGDWNDGMNRVGEGGVGESAWMGWFLIAGIDAFAPLAEARGDTERAERLRAHRESVAAAMEREAWDGAWYRRGWFDNGAPLGSAESDECRIDAIAQSWAMISGAADPDRARQAADSALEQLTDEKAQIFRLFAPSFDRTENEPGYIKSYPPGVRENGGQYTHAAGWMIYALARDGRTAEAHRLFALVNPVNHALTREAADRYRVEPYVVAADVYSAPERPGQGGWTWYTGSAGWLYRAAVEGILGITLEGGEVRVRPNLPPDWPGFTATLNRGGETRRIEVRRAADGSVAVDMTPPPRAAPRREPEGALDEALTDE